MSKERARRRAEERARKNAPHTKAATTEAVHPPRSEGKQVHRRSARAERHRRRLITIVVCWAVANVLIWLVWQSWQAIWIGLTVTTVAAPVIAWLLWDPEGRVDL